MRKKITAIIMCVLMMVTLLPVSVVADEATATNKVYLGASCLKKGEELNFGRYNHEEDNGVLQGESWDFHYTNLTVGLFLTQMRNRKERYRCQRKHFHLFSFPLK